MIGGRRLTRRLSGQSARLQLATGAVMVLVAVLMLGDYDLRFQTAIANDLPAFLVNPSKELEESGAAKSRLADLRGDRRPDNRARPHATGAPLPVLGNAPDFAGTQTLVQHRRRASRSRCAKLRGHPRPRGLLDLHLHQLHPHAAVPEGVGRSATGRPGS